MTKEMIVQEPDDQNEEEVISKDEEEGSPKTFTLTLTSDNKLLRRRLFPDNNTSTPALRSCSFRNRPRPKFLNVEAELHRRSSLPSPSVHLLSVSFDDISRRTREGNEPLRRVRSFKTTSKGIVNRGDSFKRSSTSISSTGSAFTHENGTGDNGLPRSRSRQRIDSTHSKDSGTAESTTSSSVPHCFKVAVLGPSGAGKTALTNQFMTSEYVAFESDDQDEAGVRTVTVLLDNEESTMEFVDRTLTSEDLEDKSFDAFAVVYSITDRGGFQVAVDTLYMLRHDIGTDRPAILIANKIDLVRKRKVAREEGRSVAAQYDCKYAETSAALNHHVDELLVGILSQIRLKVTTSSVPHDRARVSETKPPKHRKTKMSGPRKLLAKIFGKNTKPPSACENLMK